MNVIRSAALMATAIVVVACSMGIASPEGVAPTLTASTTSTTEAPSPTPAPTASPLRNPTEYVEGETYAPVVDPTAFGGPIDNPYFPLAPGTTYVFEGGTERNEVAITRDSKVIMGVTTVVVHDRVWDEDVLTEETYDWYAQDAAGNVWYFGEDTKSYEGGATSTEGSWEAGVAGALPGVIMLADPQVGDTYREEYLAGQAEDLARITQIGGSKDVAAGRYDSILLTENWTPLEPDVVEEKTYAPAVGFIFERYVKGGEGTVELTEIQTGG